MQAYPSMLAEVDHVEPAPRRIRAVLDGVVVVDTTRALYVWEIPYYPQYYIPADDVAPEFLVDEEQEQHLPRGTARQIGLQVAGHHVGDAGRHYVRSPIDAIVGHYRFDWNAFDSWYEEDERVYVHPRSPYTRVDALRSARTIRVELDHVVLAEASSMVMVFETGLPTRYYLDRDRIDLTHLRPSTTATECPYKGRTTEYWSVEVGGRTVPDLAWSYEFPTRQLQPIAGLVAFYNEKVDIVLDGVLLDRPVSHFS